MLHRIYLTRRISHLNSVWRFQNQPFSFQKQTTLSFFSSSIRKPTKVWPRRLVMVAGGFMAIGAGTFTILSLQDDTFIQRTKRSWAFWKELFPIYLHYRYVQWKVNNLTEQEKQDAFSVLHRKYAQPILDLSLRLRGFYVKLGQVGCTRSDFVPIQYREVLQYLFDKVPPLPGPEVRKIIEDSLGKKIDDIFSEFNDVALGAASIAQVHRAVLHDGTVVAVKVQYPDAFELFKQDFITTRQFASIAQPEFLPILDELIKQILQEFDFTREAWALDTISSNMKVFSKIAVVPKPILSLATRHVVVMEFIEGTKLVDGIIEYYTDLAKKMGMTLEQLRTKFENQYHHNQSLKQENVLKKIQWSFDAKIISAYIGLVWDGTVKYYAIRIWNWTLDLLRIQSWHLTLPKKALNHAKLLDHLIKIHGHQVLINGVFNADPHPGNIYIMNDGRLGLIDYGQVKVLTDKQRVDFANLILYLANNDEEKVREQWINVGFKTEKMDPYVIYKTALTWFDNDGPIASDGKNLQEFFEYLSKRDKTVIFPSEYVMVGRTCMLLRGLGTLLNHPPVSIAKAWEPMAKQCLMDLEEKD